MADDHPLRGNDHDRHYWGILHQQVIDLTEDRSRSPIRHRGNGTDSRDRDTAATVGRHTPGCACPWHLPLSIFLPSQKVDNLTALYFQPCP
ncbi:hypothetical protein FPOAC2_01084 [Fusarium poae]